MKTSVTLRLDKRYKKDSGVYPVILRIGHKRRTNSIKVGYEVSDKDWDSKNYEIKSSYKGANSVVRLNKLIQSKKATALDVIAQLDDINKLNDLSVTEVKNEILKSLEPENHKSTTDIQTSPDFFSFSQRLIEDMVTANQIGNARVYKDARNIFKTFHGKKKLPFEKIDYKYLNKFEIYHYSKGNTTNSLSVYLRTIRAIYNKAIKSGIVSREHYPFIDYKIKTEPTRKRAIRREAIKRIIDLDLNSNSSRSLSRDLFVASYCLVGMNFKDLSLLKVNDIVDGRIKYQREKTKEQFNIKIIVDTPKFRTALFQN